jgi:OOP family OmpA-OmpF porin
MSNCFKLKLAGSAVALALATLAGPTLAADGYVTQTIPQNNVVTTAYGECVKTSYWTPADAALPCDAVRVVSVPPPPVAVVQPAPIAAPAPTPLVVAPAPPPPVIEQISLSSDVLFEFDKAELRPTGREKLDEIADRLKGANVQQILAVGHADRIGNENYNKKLSAERADAVRAYLTQKGVEPTKVRTEGRGEEQPVTAGQCKGVTGQKLISCLQPDRRVDIEVRGERQVAGTPAPGPGAAAGSTGGAGSSGAASGGAASSGATSGSTSGGATSGGATTPSTPSGGAGSSGAPAASPTAPSGPSTTPGSSK